MDIIQFHHSSIIAFPLTSHSPIIYSSSLQRNRHQSANKTMADNEDENRRTAMIDIPKRDKTDYSNATPFQPFNTSYYSSPFSLRKLRRTTQNDNKAATSKLSQTKAKQAREPAPSLTPFLSVCFLFFQF